MPPAPFPFPKSITFASFMLSRSQSHNRFYSPCAHVPSLAFLVFFFEINFPLLFSDLYSGVHTFITVFLNIFRFPNCRFPRMAKYFKSLDFYTFLKFTHILLLTIYPLALFQNDILEHFCHLFRDLTLGNAEKLKTKI